jgi:hypothetical protein
MAVKKSTKLDAVVPTMSPYQLWAWILLAWGLYRYFVHLPEWADEFIFKPLVFVVPVIWYVLKKERLYVPQWG